LLSRQPLVTLRPPRLDVVADGANEHCSLQRAEIAPVDVLASLKTAKHRWRAANLDCIDFLQGKASGTLQAVQTGDEMPLIGPIDDLDRVGLSVPRHQCADRGCLLGPE
jgi:hypothetical protein